MGDLWCALPFTDCSRNDRTDFDRAVAALRADVTAAAAMVVNDGHVRGLYQQQVTAAAQALEREAQSGRITWAEAARQAQGLRNDVMAMMRGRTSPIGRALAEHMKREGLTRETLLTRYAERLFGPGSRFDQLDAPRQQQVQAEIVRAAGRSNPQVTAALARWSRLGRGLIVLSLAVSVYRIAMAEDHGQAALREGAVLSSGMLGGVAGGAAAGLVCGPGAPVCVTVGAFVGGALAAFGVGALF